MMPMLNQLNLGGGGAMDKESQIKFRRYQTIMDSMRDKELDETDSRKLFSEVLFRRVARGSGSSLVCPFSLIDCNVRSVLVVFG
jgi:signal recognition particle GTPase